MCVRSFHRGSIRIDTILRVSSVSCRVWANKKSSSLAVTRAKLAFALKLRPNFQISRTFFSLSNFPQTSWKILRFQIQMCEQLFLFSLFLSPKKKNFCNFSKIISGNNNNIVFSVCKKLSFFIKSRLRIKILPI